uniref:Uncharacterized protein n=1 Tax=Ananas comosus var. bracteatus TaxID=296719 RepID=A0A6V7P1I0_ANACO|nr:unnamed protein product [Ananas comosus var. bracteatus]
MRRSDGEELSAEVTVVRGCYALRPIPIWPDPSTSNRRRTDRVSPIRPRLITCTNSNKKCTSGNIHKRLTRGLIRGFRHINLLHIKSIIAGTHPLRPSFGFTPTRDA